MRSTPKVGVAALLAAAGFAASAAPASAVVTNTEVTNPGPETFADPALGTNNPVVVAGTTDSNDTDNDELDIRCTLFDGTTSAGNALNPVPVEIAGDGSFSTMVELGDFYYNSCRLIAVPQGAGAPFDLAHFDGPVVHNSGHSFNEISGGINDGKLIDYFQSSSAVNGYWSVNSAGSLDCFVADGYVNEPVDLAYDQVFSCSAILRELPPDPSTTLDGSLPIFPADGSGLPMLPGLREIEDLDLDWDPADGTFEASDREPISACTVPPPACGSLVSSEMRVEQTQSVGDTGRTLAVTHDWVNTASTTRQLHAVYSVGVAGGPPGWRFPGEVVYTNRNTGDTVTPPASGAGSFHVAEDETSTCLGIDEACGALTWAAPPDEIEFALPSTALLTFDRAIPPGCSARIALTYSQGFPQETVEDLADDAEAALTTSPSIICPPPGQPPSTGGGSISPPATTPARKKCKKKQKLKKGKCVKRKRKKKK